MELLQLIQHALFFLFDKFLVIHFGAVAAHVGKITQLLPCFGQLVLPPLQDGSDLLQLLQGLVMLLLHLSHNATMPFTLACQGQSRLQLLFQQPPKIKVRVGRFVEVKDGGVNCDSNLKIVLGINKDLLVMLVEVIELVVFVGLNVEGSGEFDCELAVAEIFEADDFGLGPLAALELYLQDVLRLFTLALHRRTYY